MLLLTDWDETVSAHDTLALIAPPDGATSFAQLSEAYMRDLDAHTARHAKGSTLEERARYLASLDEVELASQSRVEASGLFRGFDPAAMDERARRHVVFRRGWSEAAQWAGAHTSLHVISVGWSARFIAAALSTEQGGRCRPRSICANEIELDTAGRGTGRLTKSRDCSPEGRSGIRVAQDKVRELRRICQAHSHDVVVYCGDSNTDLLAMCEADVALLFGEADSLRKTLAEMGMAVLAPGDALPGGRAFVHVRDWATALPILQDLHAQRTACSKDTVE